MARREHGTRRERLPGLWPNVSKCVERFVGPAMPHLLIVDDEDQGRTLLRARFEKEGFMVTEARDAAELWQRLESGSVDLITLDLTLGRDDGLVLAREIRAKLNLTVINASPPNARIDGIGQRDFASVGRLTVRRLDRSQGDHGSRTVHR